MPSNKPRQPPAKRRDVLTRMQRRAVDLYVPRVITQKAIAKRFGVTPSAISQRLKRARERLAKAAGPRVVLVAPGPSQHLPTFTTCGIWCD